MVAYADVLDYSAGWPSPAAIRAGNFGGAIRYVGTAGRGKNLTLAEAQAFANARLPLAYVHEQGAGWMLGGGAAGAAAARAALADVATYGVGLRALYLACDVDVTTSAQMAAVMNCLDGAAPLVGRSRLGIYGEADVVDAALAGKHATWGWQTRAWSGSRVSSRAHVLQQVGYVYPGGVQCDRSTVLAADGDWGGWVQGGLVADLTDKNLTDIANRVVEVLANDRAGALYAIRQQVITALNDPTHSYLVDEFAQSNAVVTAKVDEARAALSAQLNSFAVGVADAVAAAVLAGLPADAAGAVDYAQVQRAAELALRNALTGGIAGLATA